MARCQASPIHDRPRDGKDDISDRIDDKADDRGLRSQCWRSRASSAKDPVEKYLPEFKGMGRPQSKDEPCRVRHVR